MLNLQKEFLNFHETIKLDDENETLREKREILLKKLKENIAEEAATYTTFNQGSYAMGTGILPEDEDYDMDVGIKFDISKDDFEDPIEPKKWVRDALNGHTKSVKIRRSCVTVTYQNVGEALYHVDFAIYAAQNSDGKMYIAKGKEYSTEENKKWEPSDSQGLINVIKNKYNDKEAAQFRRVIRYLKKWKTHNFDSSGNAAPTGISLTVLVYDLFCVNKETDWVTGKETYNDFEALRNLVKSIKNKFSLVWNNEDAVFYHTISVHLPVEPYNELFEKMTANQMESFYQKIDSMSSKLDEVSNKSKRAEACSLLVDIFGSDFPVTVDRSTVGTSESA